VGVVDRLLGPVILPNRWASAVYCQFLCNDLPVPLKDVVHSWWGTTAFSLHYHMAPEPDCKWTVAEMWRFIKLACMTPKLNVDFWLCMWGWWMT